MSVLIKFILYLNGEKDSKFIIRPLKVCFLYIEVMNSLLFLLISMSTKFKIQNIVILHFLCEFNAIMPRIQIVKE